MDKQTMLSDAQMDRETAEIKAATPEGSYGDNFYHEMALIGAYIGTGNKLVVEDNQGNQTTFSPDLDRNLGRLYLNLDVPFRLWWVHRGDDYQKPEYTDVNQELLDPDLRAQLFIYDPRRDLVDIYRIVDRGSGELLFDDAVVLMKQL